ncbi:Retrotransposon gag protein [Popillia japonica]|uniref:Retrotransposon gag protein n=1 Tax=Popillia japonica TaxID=7064 RepID=A0AAW1MZ42_POPJA
MDQDTAGTVDELRKRLSTFLKTNPTQTSSRPTSPTPPTTDPTQRDTTMAVCEKVRKWGLKEFWTSWEEFWTSWEDFLNDFKTQYLPPRYDYLIEEEIRARHQRPTESFQAYLTGILTLMRRGKALNDSERVERVYRNMRPEYKLYARRDAFKTLKELAALAAEYELIQRESRMAPGYALGATNPRRPEQRVQAAPATNVARENDHQQAAVLQGTPGMATKGHVHPTGSQKD